MPFAHNVKHIFIHHACLCDSLIRGLLLRAKICGHSKREREWNCSSKHKDCSKWRSQWFELNCAWPCKMISGCSLFLLRFLNKKSSRPPLSLLQPVSNTESRVKRADCKRRVSLLDIASLFQVGLVLSCLALWSLSPLSRLQTESASQRNWDCFI